MTGSIPQPSVPNSDVDLTSDGELPADEYGPIQMFNVPNPPSDIIPDLSDEVIDEAMERHCATSQQQFEGLPLEVRRKALETNKRKSA